MKRKSIVCFFLPLILLISIPASICGNVSAKSNKNAEKIFKLISTKSSKKAIKKSKKRNNLVNFSKKYYGKNLNYFLSHSNENSIMADCFDSNEWCDMFMSYVVKSKIPGSSIAINSGRKTFFNCNYWYKAIPKIYKKKVHNKKLSKRYVPQKGDLIFFDKHKNIKGVDHVGMVVSVNKKKHTIKTIEGNINNKRKNTTYNETYVLYRTYKMTHSWIYSYVQTV